MKLQYFEQGEPDADDMQLAMAKAQGYVPRGCLLGGQIVMDRVTAGEDPCFGCNGPRDMCGGRKPKVGGR